MGRLKIVADEDIPFLKGVLEPFVDIEYFPGALISQKNILKADALLVRTRTACNAELLEGTHVRYIASATIGHDHIDSNYCSKNGILWSNAKGCNSNAVKEYVLAALLKCFEGKLPFSNAILGVVGVGNVGSKVVEMAKALGMQVLLNDPPREKMEGGSGFVSIEEIKRESDIISFHTPLILKGEFQTAGMVGANFIKSLKKGTCLVNTSRGEVMDSFALIQALKTGSLGDVILDVWENEPAINLELLNRARVATPHIAGYSILGKYNGTFQAVKWLADQLGLQFSGPMSSFSLNEPLHFKLDMGGRKCEEVLSGIVRKVYDINTDIYNLKKEPEQFENLRNNYNYRREYSSMELNLLNASIEQKRFFESLGFMVV